MNRFLKSINEETILFLDIKITRKSPYLDADSKEFETYQFKIRDKSDDSLLDVEDVIKDYERRASLRLTYNKVAIISMAYLKDGKVVAKTLYGEESKILEDFFEISSKFDYLCGYNLIDFALPVMSVNGSKYFDITSKIPDRFTTNGKKPWDMKNILDLKDIFSGTYFSNSSLLEICEHYELCTDNFIFDYPQFEKDYFAGKLKDLIDPLTVNILSCVNVFRKMKFEGIVENILIKTEDFVEEPKSILHELYETKNFDSSFQARLIKHLKSKKMLKKHIPTIKKFIEASYKERIDIMAMNKKELQEINEQRQKEIDEFTEKISK